jgi:hypothetical protein
MIHEGCHDDCLECDDVLFKRSLEMHAIEKARKAIAEAYEVYFTLLGISAKQIPNLLDDLYEELDTMEWAIAAK